MDKKNLFSIVIPVYYNENNLLLTVPVLQKVCKSLSHYDFELVFVDDGSGDRSYDVLKAFQRNDNRIKIIKLARNFGSINAIQAGLKYARGDLVGVISADLQDPPNLFKKMVVQWEKGHKVVLATRQEREDRWIDTVFSNFFYLLVRRFVLENMPKGGADVLLLDKQVVQLISEIDEKNTSIIALIIWLGFKPVQIPYIRKKRKIGKSRWSLAKKIKLLIDTFTAFSYSPIRLISFIGIMIAFASFFYGGFIIYNRIVNNISVEGWSSLIVIVLFLSGFQLISLGVLGEYLWRNFYASKNRPNYIVDSILE